MRFLSCLVYKALTERLASVKLLSPYRNECDMCEVLKGTREIPNNVSIEIRSISRVSKEIQTVGWL